MKQRLVWAMSKKQIATREDVTKCLTDAVNELRLSKENNLDPSCAYPNTMAHLNADRYALAAPDAPGWYEPDPEPRKAAVVEDVIRRLGVRTDAAMMNCYGCGKPGHM